MHRILTVMACTGALLLSACTGGSSLPEPTGKGSIRALNAIPGSPTIRFLIEEVAIGDLPYKDGSAPRDYDDFVYRFNFEASLDGTAVLSRIASFEHAVEKDRSHIFVLTGDVNAPTVLTWNCDIPTWTGTETTFEASFAHAMPTYGEVDVYITLDGETPQPGQQAATLNFGETGTAALYEAGDYVITITAPGDLGTVYFTSTVQPFIAQTAHVIAALDGDANDAAPITLRGLTSGGAVRRILDATYAPTLRAIHASAALPAVDVYDDEALTSLFTTNLDRGNGTPDLPVSGEAATYYATPAGATSAVLVQQDVVARSPGTRTQMVFVGAADAYRAVVYEPDRASFSTAVRLSLFNATSNAEAIDVYILDRDEALTEDSLPRSVQHAEGQFTQTLRLPAASYDVYVTRAGEKTAFGGPYPIDAVAGDVFELFALDTVDPNVAEIRAIPLP